MSETEDTLATRIEAARQRSLAAAESAAQRARGVIEDHPVAAVAGGVVIGALIAGLLVRRKRKPTKTVPEAASEPALIGRIASIAGQIALTAAKTLAETGKDGADCAQHGADALGKAASETLTSLLARFTRH